MAGIFDDNRNPLIIPEQEARPVISCPHCKTPADYTCRRVQGVTHFTCRKCNGKWEGGLPQEPQDPRIPLPTTNYVPPVRFAKDSKGGDVEIRRRIDTRTDFRRGALIPPEGED